MAEEKSFSGLIFVGCMSIGGGLGLLFGRPEVGGAVGMGIGFFVSFLGAGLILMGNKIVRAG